MRKLFKFSLHQRKLNAEITNEIFKVLIIKKRIVSAETIRGYTVMWFFLSAKILCSLNVRPVIPNFNGLLMSKSRPLYIDVGNYPSKRLKINCCQLLYIMVSSTICCTVVKNGTKVFKISVVKEDFN